MVQSSPASENGNVFALFEAAALAHPDRAFLVGEGAPLLTYAGMLDHTGRAAGWLRGQGIGPGDRVLVQVDKSPASVILYLACLRAGAVFIPLNTAYQESELGYFLGDSEPGLLVASPGLPGASVAFAGARCELSGDLAGAPWARTSAALPTVQAAPADPAAILYTSGTTGRSKGAVLTHGNLASNVTVLGKAWRWRDDDVLLHALPIFHVHGLLWRCI